MKNCLFKAGVVIAFLLFAQKGFSQYDYVYSEKRPLGLQIVQIDFTEFSTLIFLRYINKSGSCCMNIGDVTYIKDAKTGQVYKMLNSINIPINDEGEPKVHLLDKKEQKHYFCLEFEKLPKDIEEFDLIEDETNPNAFNFYGITIDRKDSVQHINIDDFVRSTPVKEYGYNIKDGSSIYYYKHNGLSISMAIYYDKNYGKYYQVWLNIQNFTGKKLLFAPNNIVATSFVGKKDKRMAKNLNILSYEKYMKKVNRQQAWSAFAVAFGNSMAASNAGYSYSTTTASATGRTNTYGSASGYVGNTYGYASGYASSYSTAYGRSHTQSYDGAAAYAAQQNASNNTNAYLADQYQIKSRLSEGYVKSNTLPNQSEYVGYFNIKYLKTDNMTISIPINGETYTFLRTWSKVNK